ncbi:thiamine pyrophosphate-binding protein [Nocardia pseudovaccinii]|uniref:thiamine pyrophosphate-binding protein n=1 Tax=Nocardia pseudovaccinii TaxID=189540 RepID=UPI003D94776A
MAEKFPAILLLFSEVSVRVREGLADAVRDAGVDVIFGLMGSANQNLMCDLGFRHRMRIVRGRHESAVASMADGFARFSGRFGVATVTAGPGLTNTGTALAVARGHRSPVLVLAGEVARGDKRNPQQLDQLRFGHLVAGGSGRISDAAQWRAEWERAVTMLRSGRPYVLSVPVDVQESPIPATATPPTRAEPDTLPSEAVAAAAVLADAEQIGVVAGSGARAAAHELRCFADRFGAVLTTTLPAAGLFAGHRLDAGVCGGMGDGRALRALGECDVVLAVGTSLHPMAISGFADSTRVVRIDSDRSVVAEVRDTEIALHATAATGVAAVLALLDGTPARTPCAAVVDIVADRRPIDDRPWHNTESTLDPRCALEAVLGQLPHKRAVVIGGGHAAVTAAQLIPPTGAREWGCVSTDFGAIGQALPVAIGACVARPELRVFHITGDGELMMSLAELDSAVRQRLSLTVVILNDGGFAQERHNLRRAELPLDYADYESPDFCSLAAAFGARSVRVAGPNDLLRLRSALGHSSGVVVIDVAVTPEYLNPASQSIAHALHRGAGEGAQR